MRSISPSLSGQTDDLFSVEFFDLQLRFAERVAEVSGQPLAETIGCYTNLYVRLAMGQRLDPGNVDWQGYLAELAASPERSTLTHTVHRRRRQIHSGPTPARTEGCFSYELVSANHIRLHFHALCVESSLSAATRGERLSELANLFAHLKASSGDDMQVIGASWLYNLDCYRRLFPGRYLASLRPIEHPYQRLPLWGQFLRRDRTVRPAAALRFLTGIAEAASMTELARCFPLNVLATVAPATWFYEQMGL
jgi:hypothetical protein